MEIIKNSVIIFSNTCWIGKMQFKTKPSIQHKCFVSFLPGIWKPAILGKWNIQDTNISIAYPVSNIKTTWLIEQDPNSCLIR